MKVILYDNIVSKQIYTRNEAVCLEWTIEYYQKENGSIPVEDFLLTLNPKQDE